MMSERMRNRPVQIVIDTNVIVSGLRSKRGAAYRLLCLLNDPRWEVNISTTLLFEYGEILKREFAGRYTEQDLDDLLDGFCHIARQRDIFYVWRPASADPDNEFLIDLAISAQADFLITYNPRDVQRVKQFGVKVVTPGEFLHDMEVL